VKWRVLALLKVGSEERPENLDALLSRGFNLLWHLSNAFSASMLEENKILNLLNPFAVPKGTVVPIIGKYYRST